MDAFCISHLYQDREQRDLQQASAAGHSTCLSGADKERTAANFPNFPQRLPENGARDGRDSYNTDPTNQPHLKSDFTSIFLALILKVAPRALWVACIGIACLKPALSTVVADSGERPGHATCRVVYR